MAIQWEMWNSHISKTCSFASIKIQLVSGQNWDEQKWVGVWCSWYSGDYIAAASSSLAINDEQLLQNLAPPLSEKIKETHDIPWPPRVDDLEEAEKGCGLLVQLLSWLKQPKQKNPDLSPETLSLASMITCHVTGSRTSTVVNTGVTVHGITSGWNSAQEWCQYQLCRYIACLWKLGSWLVLKHQQPAHQRLQMGSLPFWLWTTTTSRSIQCQAKQQELGRLICPEGSVVVKQMQSNHRTNVMFVQPQNYEK